MTAQRRKQHESNRGRAFIISVVGGLTLLALAATVFAVATQARSVSRQAEQAVRIIEDLRVVSIARAELSIASRVSLLSPDQTEIIESTLSNADDALAAVESNFDTRTLETIRSAFGEYRAASDAQSELIARGGVSREDAQAAELATGEAFDALSEVMRAEQVASLERLRADNDLMNVISTLATFVVAFVVPSAALYIFEALRRTPRRARQIERDFDSLSAKSKAMAAALAKEAAHLRATLNDLPPELDSDGLLRSVLRFEHVAALNGAVRSLHNVDVDVEQLCATVIETFDDEVILDASHGAESMIYGDRDQVTLVVFELLHNATTHGRGPVRLEVLADESDVTISVIDHGPGLPDTVEDGIIHDNEFAARGNLLSGSYGFGLLAVREAVESLGGCLRYHRAGGETALIVELPRSQSAVPAAPIQMDLPAALEGRSAA